MPVSKVDETTARAAADDAAPGLGVYVHWPFCLSKCPYCDFNSHVAQAIDHDRWQRALVAELDHFRGLTEGRTVRSVFFGGGTPSLMRPETVAAMIDAVRRGWPVADDLEITLEANPSSAEAGRFRAFKGAGVNRLSLGVQSFADDALRFLGRGHSAAEAVAAVAAAAESFGRFSFDLIYALPGQTTADWRDQLRQALAIAGGHLSCYQLAVEPGTAFHRERVEAADGDRGALLYAVAQETLEAAGLSAYEISNHARPGQACRHNLFVWRGGDYLGIGPGAHGRLRRAGPGRDAAEARHQIHAPERWLAAVEKKGHATAKTIRLTPRDRAEELVMTGLRLAEGISRRRFRALTGLEPESVLDGGALGRLAGAGFVETAGDVLRATDKGRPVLNALLRTLLA